jgi:hypothetical protein
MRIRVQFGWVGVLVCSALMALPSAAQNRNTNRPPQAQKPQQGQAQRPAQPRPQQNAPRAQNRTSAERSRNAAPINPAAGNSLNRGNPPANKESVQRPNFNPNRPPNAGNPQANPKRFQDLSSEDKRKVLQNQEKFNRLPPQKQQEMREAARNWNRLTPGQQAHIKNDVLPKWQQLPPDRQKAIRQRLGVLQNMPESARNQHLNDPNFTRGMSEEDKAMLHDLSHMHIGAPDPPNE